MWEWAKIWGICILAAVVYGILHDQVTARICVEYFTVFHPVIMTSTSPTLLAIGWGILATWWVGAILGFLLAIAARVGHNPRLTARQLVLPVSIVLLAMGIAAAIAGVIGWHDTTPNMSICYRDTPEFHARFTAVWSAHKMSYLAGEVGGILLCLYALFLRWRLTIRKDHPDAQPSPAPKC